MKLPFKISRTLKRYISASGQQVLIRVRSGLFNDIEIPVYDYYRDRKFKISVKKDNWQKGYITGGTYHMPVRYLNSLLDKIEYAVSDSVLALLQQKVPVTRDAILNLTYISVIKSRISEDKVESGEILTREDGGAFESEEDFLDFLERQDDPSFVELKRKAGMLKRIYIMDYWDEFIETYAPDSYNLTKSSIINYIQTTGDNCRADEYNSEWLKKYFDYIINNGYKKKVKKTEVTRYYEISTIKRYLKSMRSFGKWLFESGIINTEDYKRFSLNKKDSKKSSYIKFKSTAFKNTHALLKSEFDHLFYFEFKDKSKELIRDLFVIQTWFGGLRKGDFFDLTENNIVKDSKGNITIQFEQQKTEEKVINPANKNYVMPILEKYDFNLPTFPSSNKYNARLKKVFEEAGLDRNLEFRFEYINQKKATTKYFKMFQKVSNRWARNCAVSILVEQGYSDHYIMKFTGHEDEKMLRHYRTVHKKEVKDMLDDVKPEKPKKES